jgi:glycosyltransferase involved in cell wall biosynthesis
VAAAVTASPPPRILVMTVVHVPLDARIHHRQIRSLVAAGFEVTYAAPWSATGTDPTAAVDGVRAIELPRATGRRRGAALAAARRTIRQIGGGFDLILVHDPELALAFVAQRGRLPPVVLDVHEDLAASLPDRPWVPSALRPVLGRVARLLERWTEAKLHLILAETGYLHRFSRNHLVVPNLPWLADEPPPAGSTDRVVHLGRLSVGRGVHELLLLGQQLADAGGPRLELVGPADAEVRDDVAAAHARGWVVWHGFVPNERALDLVQGSVAGVALLHDLPNYRVSLPTKIVEYLAHGVPAIVTPLPESRRLIEASGAGFVVPFGDVGAAAAAVAALVEDAGLRDRMGAAGRAYVADEYSWNASAPRFVEHLEQLIAETRR